MQFSFYGPQHVLVVAWCEDRKGQVPFPRKYVRGSVTEVEARSTDVEVVSVRGFESNLLKVSWRLIKPHSDKILI